MISSPFLAWIFFLGRQNSEALATPCGPVDPASGEETTEYKVGFPTPHFPEAVLRWRSSQTKPGDTCVHEVVLALPLRTEPGLEAQAGVPLTSCNPRAWNQVLNRVGGGGGGRGGHYTSTPIAASSFLHPKHHPGIAASSISPQGKPTPFHRFDFIVWCHSFL